MTLRYFHYRFPFAELFRTSRQTFKAREGVLLQLQREGITAYGEAAPLPEFSRESLDQVTVQLKKHTTVIKRYFQHEIGLGGLDHFYRDNDIVPSLCFALDTLIYDYLSQKQGSRMSHMLFEHPQTVIPVNAVLPIQSVTETLQAAASKINEGYRTFKFKIGGDFAENIDILEGIKNRFPDITIRIDANQSWNLEEALDKLAILGKMGVEYCEEPLARPSASALKQLSEHSPVPIALDESLNEFKNDRTVAACIPVWVIKPMVTGSFTNIYQTKQLAKAHGNKLVFTTTLESGIGRMMTAVLASGLGSRESAHGLDTGGFLKTDVWHDGVYINNGYFSLPDDPEPGKKYRFDPQNLAEEIQL